MPRARRKELPMSCGQDGEDKMTPEQFLQEGRLWPLETARSPIVFGAFVGQAESVQRSLGDACLSPRHLALAAFAHPAVQAEIMLIGCAPKDPETCLRISMLSRLNATQSDADAERAERGMIEFLLACREACMCRDLHAEDATIVDPMDLLARVMLLATQCDDVDAATRMEPLYDFRLGAFFNRFGWLLFGFAKNPQRLPSAAEIRESLRFAPDEEEEYEVTPRSAVWQLNHGEHFSPGYWDGWPLADRLIPA